MANLGRAARAFEDFTGHKPSKVTRAQLDAQNVAGWKMGPVVGVAYEAKRDGETDQYFHRFKKSARPDLIARDDGRQLYISGGRYKVTERGIEDMPALLVVNPSPRGGAKRSTKVAKTRRSRTASGRFTKKRAARTSVYVTNPKRRRRRSTAARGRSYRRNPIAGRRVRRGASRALGQALNFGKMFMPAIGIGLGALGAEFAMGMLPIPANFKVGPMRQLTKGVIAVAAGMAISKLLKQPRLGNAVALGGLVIAVHDFAKEFLVQRFPAVQLGYYNPGSMVGMGEYMPRLTGGMGAYVATSPGGFGGASSDGYGSGQPSFGI